MILLVNTWSTIWWSVVADATVTTTLLVADPGFPVGGRGPRRGAWTPKAVTFGKFCMSKRKNLDL